VSCYPRLIILNIEYDTVSFQNVLNELGSNLEQEQIISFIVRTTLSGNNNYKTIEALIESLVDNTIKSTFKEEFDFLKSTTLKLASKIAFESKFLLSDSIDLNKLKIYIDWDKKDLIYLFSQQNEFNYSKLTEIYNY